MDEHLQAAVPAAPHQELARRERAVRIVVQSGRLEGFRDDAEWIASLQRFARGDATRDELHALARAR